VTFSRAFLKTNEEVLYDSYFTVALCMEVVECPCRRADARSGASHTNTERGSRNREREPPKPVAVESAQAIANDQLQINERSDGVSGEDPRRAEPITPDNYSCQTQDKNEIQSGDAIKWGCNFGCNQT